METGLLASDVLSTLPKNVELIGPVHASAALYAAAPPETQVRRGPRRKKGDRLKSKEAWEQDSSRWQTLHYEQYGLHGSLRVKTCTGLYYKAGKDRLLRFVLSQDTVGGRPTRIFYSTDVNLKPREILSLFSRRWSIEVTHFDCKQHLGLEDPANRVPKAVPRTAPMACPCQWARVEPAWAPGGSSGLAGSSYRGMRRHS